ncbi:MAG TPA: ATP-binding protein [Arcobacter sp.]|jgi:AAA+ ATPase superfamily predicted ATPase|nr:ATP-binding protein [Arcobacter sp.]
MVPINQDNLVQLNETFHNSNSSFHIIYGANKSGKTTFIRDFMVKKSSVYFSGFSSTAKILFPTYIEVINRKFKLKQSSRYYNTFESILSLLTEQTINEKTAIIFDNFQELIKIDKNVLNILVKYWDTTFKKQQITLICTLNNLQYQEYFDILSPKIISLEQFPFENIQKKPVLTHTDKFYIYSIFGASSYFLSFYNTKLELTKNVYQIVFQPNSPFYNYGFEYLQKDFSDIGTFSSILHAIAIGKHKIGQIAEFLDVKSTYLTRYMKKLQDALIIKKELPIKQNYTYSKYGRYYISNHFLRFWFCYVYPNKNSLDIKKHTPVLKKLDTTITQFIITPTYKNYIIKRIESNPLKYLGFSPHTFGPWWDNNGNNIDLVAYDDEHIVFVNILWETKEKAILQYNHLKEMSTYIETTKKKNYIIISKQTYLNNL